MANNTDNVTVKTAKKIFFFFFILYIFRLISLKCVLFLGVLNFILGKRHDYRMLNSAKYSNYGLLQNSPIRIVSFAECTSPHTATHQ